MYNRAYLRSCRRHRDAIRINDGALSAVLLKIKKLASRLAKRFSGLPIGRKILLLIGDAISLINAALFVKNGADFICIANALAKTKRGLEEAHKRASEKIVEITSSNQNSPYSNVANRHAQTWLNIANNITGTLSSKAETAAGIAGNKKMLGMIIHIIGFAIGLITRKAALGM